MYGIFLFSFLALRCISIIIPSWLGLFWAGLVLCWFSGMYVGLAIKSEPMIREGGEYDGWEHAGGVDLDRRSERMRMRMRI